MANVINATSTGSGGLISTGDDSGVLNIQTNETTALSIDASQNVTFTNAANLPNTFGFKNRIINGAMVISQRGTGATTISSLANLTYVVDRWAGYGNAASKFSLQQSADAPTGFSNSLLATSLSAYSAGASEAFTIQQPIEGFNTADLLFGTANAKKLTLSFWVKSSLTGTFGGSFSNSATNRSYPFSYTISSANTWEQKSVTFTGDTTGTWIGATNGIGLRVYFSLGAGTSYSGTAGSWAAGFYASVTGAVSVVGTNSATFYITGVQLELGSAATAFDFRSYGTELALCQRYFYSVGTGTPTDQTVGGSGVFVSSSALYLFGVNPVTMRATPSIGYSSLSDWVISSGTVASTVTALVNYRSSADQWSLDITGTGTPYSSNNGGFMRAQSANARLTFSSEL